MGPNNPRVGRNVSTTDVLSAVIGAALAAVLLLSIMPFNVLMITVPIALLMAAAFLASGFHRLSKPSRALISLVLWQISAAILAWAYPPNTPIALVSPASLWIVASGAIVPNGLLPLARFLLDLYTWKRDSPDRDEWVN